MIHVIYIRGPVAPDGGETHIAAVTSRAAARPLILLLRCIVADVVFTPSTVHT